MARSATCIRDGCPRRAEPSRPHRSSTPHCRARASMYSRSKRKMLWPSMTSGSRSPISREHSRSISASLISRPESTRSHPVESAIAMAMMRSDGRAAWGNSKPSAVKTPMATAILRGSEKGRQRLGVGDDAAVLAPVHADPIRGVQLEGEEAEALVVAEEEGVLVELE